MFGTALLAGVALLAFAGNSVLCRLALADGAMTAESFTAVRLASGALVLALLAWRHLVSRPWQADPVAVAALLIYAECFAWAYLELDTGTGALLLFGAVQVSMTGYGLTRGERLRPWAWLGMILALGGVVSFFVPVRSPESFTACSAMVLAGVAWGVYSLRGRGRDPSPRPPGISSSPRPWPYSWAGTASPRVSTSTGPWPRQVLSGAVTSALGYAVWYRAVRALTAVTAATVQLSVPLLAALGGVAFLGETLTLKLLVAAALVLAGIALVQRGTARRAVGPCRA